MKRQVLDVVGKNPMSWMTICSLLPAMRPGTVAVQLNRLVKEGKVQRTKIQKIFYYSLPDREYFNYQAVMDWYRDPTPHPIN